MINLRSCCALVLSTLMIAVSAGAARAKCFNNQTPVPSGTAPAPQAFFGAAVAIKGPLAVIGSPFNLPNQGAHAYQWTGTSWSFITRLADPGAIPGFAGSAVDTDGVRVIVGAPGSPGGAAAIIYRYEAGSFVFEARLTPPGAGAQGNYGSAVAIDGDLAALSLNSQAGGVDIYRRVNGAWTRVQGLTSDTPMDATRFGAALDLDAGHLVVGSPADVYVPEIGEVGALYVYERTQTGVIFQQRLTAIEPQQTLGLGRSVSIDGDTIAAGGGDFTHIEDVFVFTQSAGTWSQEAVIPARDTQEFDDFGECVTVSGDLIVVGAPQDDPFGMDSGAVYVYKRSGNTWSPTTDLFNPTAAPAAYFGGAVALNEGRLLITARLEMVGGINHAGQAYSYIGNTLAGAVAPSDQSVAFGTPATFTAFATGTPPLTYQWKINGVPVPSGLPPYDGADTNSLTITESTASIAGAVTVEITDGCGFVLTAAAASLTVTPSASPCPGDANADGAVLFNDITTVLTNFGLGCR